MSCKKEYCDFFTTLADKQVVSEEKIKALLQSKASMRIAQLDWQKQNDTEGDKLQNCNMSCVSECFEKFDNHPALQILYDCVTPNCNCPKEVGVQNYDIFFLQSEGGEVPEQPPAPEEKKSGEHESNNHKVEHHHEHHYAEATFKVDFSILDDTCCLSFEWEIKTGKDDKTQGKQLYDECDLECQSDCFDMNGKIPFPIVQWCVEERCKCGGDDKVPDLYCDKGCKEQCDTDEGAHGAAHTLNCHAECGCDTTETDAMTLYTIEVHNAQRESMIEFMFGVLAMVVVAYIIKLAVDKSDNEKVETKSRKTVVHFSKEFEEDNGCDYQILTT